MRKPPPVMFPVTLTLPVTSILELNEAVPITPKLGNVGKAPLVICNPAIVAVVPVVVIFPLSTLNPAAERYCPEPMMLPVTFASFRTCKVAV